MKVDLGDGVLGPAAGAETITAWLKIRLEDRLEHRLEGGLDHPVPARWRCPAGGACHWAWGSSHGDGTEPPGLDRLAARRGRPARPGRPRRSGRSRRPPGRTSPSVASHPVPGVSQDSRVIDQVPHVVEPTIRIVGSPLVQLGLDLLYPPPGGIGVWPRIAGVHRRPPGIPVPRLRTRCPPSPCAWLSHARTTTGTPPHPGAVG